LAENSYALAGPTESEIRRIEAFANRIPADNGVDERIGDSLGLDSLPAGMLLYPALAIGKRFGTLITYKRSS
jgi:hypothetical protein